MPAVETEYTEYTAFPLRLTPDRAEIAERLLDELIQFETLFTDYQRGCEETCGDCNECLTLKAHIARLLTKPDSLVFEVWRGGENIDIVGILYFTDIKPGQDVRAHYVFWDKRLKDKTELCQQMIEWLFSDHDDWRAVNRITVEVPAYAFALARHVQRLGFGGPFTHEHKTHEIDVEGIKREAIKWRGQWQDVFVLGLLNEETD